MRSVAEHQAVVARLIRPAPVTRSLMSIGKPKL